MPKDNKIVLIILRINYSYLYLPDLHTFILPPTTYHIMSNILPNRYAKQDKMLLLLKEHYIIIKMGKKQKGLNGIAYLISVE